MPAATAAFDEPLAFELLAAPPFRALPLEDLRALPLDDLRALLPELRDDELPLRDDADAVRLLDALPLRLDALPLLDLLPEPLEVLRLFGLDPFELRELVCRLLVERVLPWAMAPP
jgi:hypothetical protein